MIWVLLLLGAAGFGWFLLAPRRRLDATRRSGDDKGDQTGKGGQSW